MRVQGRALKVCGSTTFRHTFATRLVQAGVGLYTVQKLGRWKSSAMVARYAHHNSESLRPGVNVLVQKPDSTDLAQRGEQEQTGNA